MEGIKTYRFPTINSSYGQPVSRVGHMRPAVTKVSSCVIDTPRDDGQSYRENLWSFQKHHRGVQSQNDSLPDIPFRLRSNDLGSEDQNMESTVPGFPFLDSYGTGLLKDGSLIRQMTRTRTSIGPTDPIPAVSKDSPFIAKGVSIPFARSLRLCSRERRYDRPFQPAGGSITERLPRVSGSKNEDGDSPPLKKSSSLIDVREDASERTSSTVSSVFVDINSDKIGHTTNTTIDTTLADMLNRHNNGKYYDLGGKTSKHSNKALNQNETTECESDRQWMHKFETKIVDGNVYDNFARTRKPDFEKENTKSELKSVKRPLNQRSSDNSFSRSAEGKLQPVSQKDNTPARNIGPGKTKKQMKLRLSSTRTTD